MTLKQIFTCSDKALKKVLHEELVDRFGYDAAQMHNTKDFLLAEGDAPYMLVAHLDTVHKNLPSIICYSRDGNYIMSPQGIGGDDRCGVYIILSLLHKLSFRPYILFTMGEEKGCIGAHAFETFVQQKSYSIPGLKFIVEYDRKGSKDCVFYQCDNKDFEKFVEGFGFKTAHGSCSDISVVAPKLGVAAVNLSSGYYNPHTEHEYVCVRDMHRVIDASVKMLNAECEPFKYIPKPIPTYYSGYGYGNGYSYNSYYNKRAAATAVYEQVKATLLPAGAVRVRFSKVGSWFGNLKDEIAIDEHGIYYRHYWAYRDWEVITDVEPVDAANPPKYDENNSATITVFSDFEDSDIGDYGY